MTKKLRDMKIPKKLTLGFGILIVLILIVGLMGNTMLFTIQGTGMKLYKECTVGFQYSSEALSDFQQLNFNLSRSSFTSQNDIGALVQSTKDSIAAIDNLLAQCDATLVSDIFSQRLKSIESNWQQYCEIVTKNIDYLQNNDLASVSAGAKQAGQLETAIKDDFNKLMTDLAQKSQDDTAANFNLAKISVAILDFVMLIGIVFAVVFGRMLNETISKPIKSMTRVAEFLAAGNINFTSVIDLNDKSFTDSVDEIGILRESQKRLARYITAHANTSNMLASGDLTTEVTTTSDEDVLGHAMKRLVSNLNELVSTITAAAEQVQAGARLVSGSSVALSQGATLQASAVQELTAEVEQISSQTNINAKNAVEASGLADTARINAQKGDALMKDLQKAMDNINDSSGRINKIIKVIDDIAFQTNILALNAAVEAARAGQHGKGFAVVAEEVRTLALKSANAAKETTDMIENSIKKVLIGTKIAGETAEALGNIVGQVNEAANLVNAIAIASKEQAVGVRHINEGIAQVSKVTQENLATSEESAAASEELASQSEHLSDTIGVFKIKKILGNSGDLPEAKVTRAEMYKLKSSSIDNVNKKC